jgi:EAL domain-containing protein (putative c-di-GMP-specific phosphodiesterase class I)
VGELAAGEILKILAAGLFEGTILLLGPAGSPIVSAIEELARKLEIAMLPTLCTPFGDASLRRSITPLVPIEQPPDPPIHASEAVHAGWLELWYQPKIDTKTLALRGAEGLVRVRHPSWGIVRPACFIPDDQDPHFRALFDYVIGRALEDWRGFVAHHGPLELAINLPIAALKPSEAIKRLCEQMPEHPALQGLIVELDSTEVVRNLDFAMELSKQLRRHNVAVSVIDVGTEWPGLMGLGQFPFVELKVGQRLVTGCADDSLKRTVCRSILDLADGYGTRTVADGVETQADFNAVREMGFDMAQGFLFAKPLPANKFARKTLGHPVRKQQ